MGYYPSSGDEMLTEDSPSGTGFLANLQKEGEAATGAASKAGIRVVHLRIPSVIGGNAVRSAGFQVGDGPQWMSWVGISCLPVGAYSQLSSLPQATGFVSPNLEMLSGIRRSAWAMKHFRQLLRKLPPSGSEKGRTPMELKKLFIMRNKHMKQPAKNRRITGEVGVRVLAQSASTRTSLTAGFVFGRPECVTIFFVSRQVK